MFEIIKSLLGLFKDKIETVSTTVEKPIPVIDKPQSNIVDSISKKGLLELADREGLALTKYLDSVGVQTIGIGLTKSDIKDLASWPWDKQLSVQDAVYLYKLHVKPYADAVKKALKVPVLQHQFDALTSICYNIGIGGMQGSTFMKRINSKASMESIVSAILMWDKPKEIQGRRKKEAQLFQYGAYSNKDGCVDNIDVNPTTHKPKYKGRIKIIDLL